jgi:hypothetical protein
MLICITRNFDISNIGESNMSVQGRIYLNLINLKNKSISFEMQFHLKPINAKFPEHRFD